MQESRSLSLKINQARVLEADHVVVESGVVWLTQSGSPEDVLLFGGQSFRIERPGKIVIQALEEEARVRVQSSSVISRLRRLFSVSSTPAISGFRACH